MSKKRTAIVLGINENWVFAAAALLMGLKENLSKVDPEIVIIQDGVKKREQDLLGQILPCRFIEFDQPVPDNIRHSRGTHLKFSRLLCFDLLDKYSKIIWLDTDMLILKPIDRLFDYGNAGLAMMPHRKTLSQIYRKACDIWGSNPEFSRYDFDVLVNNTGLMVFSDALNNPRMLRNWCFEKMVAWSKVNTSIQPVITLMLQEFNIHVEEVRREYNCPPHEESRKTVILHTWGDKKFWDGHSHPLWDKYYFQWMALGGEGPAIRLGPLRRSIALRMFHKELTLRFEVYNRLFLHFRSFLAKLKRVFSSR